ncbi:transposase [Spirosoma endophyticum]|uniref:Transposase n=1 Tax=Spirosoma endophyticum TaxID=662367 RepID=A0A1I2FS98_9BACT|nr:transposase [Spirosoma endophyticum]SFF07607.1 transposase [Spirosoma endophyticum]
MKKRCVFDETFKKMAVELSHAKGSVQEAARELGIDSSRITKWRQTHKGLGQLATTTSGLSQEQQLIRRLQKELKDAELERDILKKAVSIFSRGDRKSSDL